MVSQTYEFKQVLDPGFRAGPADGATAVPLRCHRTMVQASLVVSPPLSLLGAMVMALLALPRRAMLAGTVMAQAGLRTMRHRGA